MKAGADVTERWWRSWERKFANECGGEKWHCLLINKEQRTALHLQPTEDICPGFQPSRLLWCKTGKESMNRQGIKVHKVRDLSPDDVSLLQSSQYKNCSSTFGNGSASLFLYSKSINLVLFHRFKFVSRNQERSITLIEYRLPWDYSILTLEKAQLSSMAHKSKWKLSWTSPYTFWENSCSSPC